MASEDNGELVEPVGAVPAGEVELPPPYEGVTDDRDEELPPLGDDVEVPVRDELDGAVEVPGEPLHTVRINANFPGHLCLFPYLEVSVVDEDAGKVALLPLVPEALLPVTLVDEAAGDDAELMD